MLRADRLHAAEKVRIIGARVRRHPHTTADLEPRVLERQLLRPQVLCRYRPEWMPLHPEWKLREANLRCPLEGPGALELCQAAYTYRAVECPWQYRPNTSDTDPLGCWRPSTGFK